MGGPRQVNLGGHGGRAVPRPPDAVPKVRRRWRADQVEVIDDQGGVGQRSPLGVKGSQ